MVHATSDAAPASDTETSPLPEPAQRCVQQAERLLNAGDVGAAREWLERALDLAPDHRELLEAFCDIERELGNTAAVTVIEGRLAELRQPLPIAAAIDRYVEERRHLSEAEFLCGVYRDVLGRGLDEEGYSIWMTQLHGGIARQTVVHDFLNSAEFQRRSASSPVVLPALGRKAPPPVAPRTALEQYQDIWVRGGVKSPGIRQCADRFELIRSFCEQFKRPFTVLDIGCNLGYFTLRLAETFDCTVVAAEGIYGDWTEEVFRENANPRVILLKQILTLEDLRALAEVEHFDVVLALSVVHHLDGPFSESLETLRSLGDHLILELPFEDNACGPDIVKEVLHTQLPTEAELMGFGKSHLAEGRRPFFRLSRPKTRLTKSYLGTPRTGLELTIDSTFKQKRVVFGNKAESRPWHRGINLQTYLWFHGAYPSRGVIARALESITVPGGHRDIQPWNVILQGHDVQLIDFDDPNHTFSYDDAEYRKRLVNLLRSGDRSEIALEPESIRPWVSRREGKYSYFSSELFPPPRAERYTADELQNLGHRLVEVFSAFPAFYAHFGGAGDALLLLSTFYDEQPGHIVLSCPNSIPAARSFFDAFPDLGQVYFLPPFEDPRVHAILRWIMRTIPNCLGAGATPKEDYGEWRAGLDIARDYRINLAPHWPRIFGSNANSRAVCLAPKGSLSGMVGSKRNIIDPEIWPELLQLVQQCGFHPVIIGTPDERVEYPGVDGCHDRRSFSFREQMEQICRSAAFIGADSWGKTFSALAGLPTIVFEPLRGIDWRRQKDPSDCVFLDPWPTITVVKSLSECRAALRRSLGLPVEISAPSRRVSIAWEGSFDDTGSLSHVNRELTRVLQSVPNLEVHRGAREDSAITVRHAWPPNWQRPQHGKLVVIQPWEYGALPEQWLHDSRGVDEFWVPSRYVRDVFVDSGVPEEKVQVVPNGIDAARFHPGARPFALGTSKEFKFLFVGGTIARKGIDVLLETFTAAFTADDDVALVIKDFGGNSVYAGQTAVDTIRTAQSKPNAPQIIHLTQELSSEEIAGLYTACDCLVHPYRGEGFGLPILEAMACGLPVIVTAGGAADDFATDDVAIRIPGERKIFARSISGMRLVKDAWWLEPSREALIEKLRWVMSHPDEARALGARASKHAHASWTWAHAASAASQRVAALTTEPPSRAPMCRTKPCVAGIGDLCDARELLQHRQFEDAWTHTASALRGRPFHPAAWLLLAEIAVAAEDGATARRCAEQARKLAPDWKAPKQFLARKLATTKTREWPALPQTSTEPRLSVCLITKNEERSLRQCLSSIRAIAHQIVVVDTGSTDNTIAIAKEFGAEVQSFAWCDDFAAARNASLALATGDWVLVLDADEELPPASVEALRREIKQSRAMAYRLPIIDAGKETEGRHFVPRLFRNAPGIHFTGRIHENVFASVEEFRGEFGLENRLGTATILHHGYSAEATQSRGKIERNLRLLKLGLAEAPEDANLLMNFGLELARTGDLYRALDAYDRAFRQVAKRPLAHTPPEFRETLLIQYCTHLLRANCFQQIAEVLSSPLGRASSGNASLHFLHGVAAMQLKRWKDAIEHFRGCLARRDQPSLTTTHAEIRTIAPKHFLALALAYANQMDASGKVFAEAMKEAPDVFSLHYDYAGFLLKLGREVEALQKLHELAQRHPDEISVWQTGAKIALSRPEFIEVALDWTSAAHAQHSADALLATHRAAALLLAGRFSEALPLWREFHTSIDPQHLAALVICEAALGKRGELLPSSVQAATAREVMQWFKRLVEWRAESAVRSLQEHVSLLRERCPAAAEQIEKIFAGAEV